MNYFIVENSTNPEQNFREAIKEHLLSVEGAKQIELADGFYSWADAVYDVPASIWERHNIEKVQEGDSVIIANTFEIIVDHDEELIPEEYHRKL